MNDRLRRFPYGDQDPADFAPDDGPDDTPESWPDPDPDTEWSAWQTFTGEFGFINQFGEPID